LIKDISLKVKGSEPLKGFETYGIVRK